MKDKNLTVIPDFTIARAHAQSVNQKAGEAVWHALQCGLELLRIKAAHPELSQGGDRRSKPQAAVLKTWATLVEEKVGISDDTARRWMHMAKGGLQKLEIEEADWTLLSDSKRESATAKLQKLASKAESQTDFIRELYGLKPPIGFALSGSDIPRSNHQKKGKKNKTADEKREENAQDAYDAVFPLLRNDWFADRLYTHLTDVPLSNFINITKRILDEAQQIATARGIKPAQLADWDQDIK